MSLRMPAGFFFTVRIAAGVMPCGYGLIPRAHVLRGHTVGKVLQPHVKPYALAPTRGCGAAPQVGTEVGKAAGVDILILMIYLFETGIKSDSPRGAGNL